MRTIQAASSPGCCRFFPWARTPFCRARRQPGSIFDRFQLSPNRRPGGLAEARESVRYGAIANSIDDKDPNAPNRGGACVRPLLDQLRRDHCQGVAVTPAGARKDAAQLNERFARAEFRGRGGATGFLPALDDAHDRECQSREAARTTPRTEVRPETEQRRGRRAGRHTCAGMRRLNWGPERRRARLGLTLTLKGHDFPSLKPNSSSSRANSRSGHVQSAHSRFQMLGGASGQTRPLARTGSR